MKINYDRLREGAVKEYVFEGFGFVDFSEGIAKVTDTVCAILGVGAWLNAGISDE